jgi:hypothetical protein
MGGVMATRLNIQRKYPTVRAGGTMATAKRELLVRAPWITRYSLMKLAKPGTAIAAIDAKKRSVTV